MIKFDKIIPGIVTFFLVLFPINVFAFTSSETLKYELSLGGIAVGSLSLEARTGRSTLQLVSSMSTVSWVSSFFPVDDYATSLLIKGGQKGLPKKYNYYPSTYRATLSEGPYKAGLDVVFDHKKKTITCSDLLDAGKSSFKLKEFTLDPLASLYYLRSVPLIPGKSVSIHIFNNKQIRKIDVKVVKRETVKTPVGTFNTVLVTADLYFDGVGIIYNPGDVYVWLTDDERKMPVVIEKKLTSLVEGKLPGLAVEKMPALLRAKLSAGSIKATLVAK